MKLDGRSRGSRTKPGDDSKAEYVFFPIYSTTDEPRSAIQKKKDSCDFVESFWPPDQTILPLRSNLTSSSESPFPVPTLTDTYRIHPH